MKAEWSQEVQLRQQRPSDPGRLLTPRDRKEQRPRRAEDPDRWAGIAAVSLGLLPTRPPSLTLTSLAWDAAHRSCSAGKG